MCSWAKCLTLTVPLSTQEHKWLLAELLGQPGTVRQGCLQWTSIPATGRTYTPRFTDYSNPSSLEQINISWNTITSTFCVIFIKWY